jgi:DNA-binding XRE family transcriptional regulator
MGSLPFCHISLKASKPKLLQKKVGQRIGGSDSDVWNWENNSVSPAVRFMPSIIAFLGYNPMPKPEALPEQLVWHRKGRGWTQQVFAKVLGVDQSTPAGWKRGERTPTGRFYTLIASALAQNACQDEIGCFAHRRRVRNADKMENNPTARKTG